MKRWMVLGAVALMATAGVAAVGRTQSSVSPADGDDATFMTSDVGRAPWCPAGAGQGRRGGRGGRGGMAQGYACDMGGIGGMGGMMGMGGRQGGPPLETLAGLGLSDAQRARLADLREQRMKAAIPIRAELEIAQLDLQKLLRADRPDLDAVTRQVDRITDLRGSMMKSHVSGMIEARSVLTPVQQKKLVEARQDNVARKPMGGRGR